MQSWHLSFKHEPAMQKVVYINSLTKQPSTRTKDTFVELDVSMLSTAPFICRTNATRIVKARTQLSFKHAHSHRSSTHTAIVQAHAPAM